MGGGGQEASTPSLEACNAIVGIVLRKPFWMVFLSQSKGHVTEDGGHSAITVWEDVRCENSRSSSASIVIGTCAMLLELFAEMWLVTAILLAACNTTVHSMQNVTEKFQPNCSVHWGGGQSCKG